MTRDSDRDNIYAKPQESVGDFVFDQQVAQVFPDMIRRSVPGYATVINMSFGSTGDSSLVKDALSLAYSTVSLVAAAGNSGFERYLPRGNTCSAFVVPFYPAHYSFVLGVEAGVETPAGKLAGFSNCEYELRNPGSGIFSTVLDDSYATWSGTSMAAPMVAGTAGLLQANHANVP